MNPLSQTLATPISNYGITEVSRPVAAALLGFSLKAVQRRIDAGHLEVSGRVKLQVSVADIERITGRPVSVHQYLQILGGMAPPHKAHRRDGREHNEEDHPHARP